MKHEHHIASAFRHEFADLGLWRTRALVIIASVAAGLTVLAFTWITEHALATFFHWSTAHPWLPLLWMPLSAALIVWLTRRFVPGASGSGIPQVMAALEPEVAPEQRGLFVSLKLSLAKIVLSSWGLLAGLSLGREGPSVQVAAGVMLSFSPWLPKNSKVTAHGLLVTGGAAGIAAAFNTPLAGVMFAIEELSRSPEQRSSGLLVTGIVLAGLIAVSISGNATYFGVIHAVSVDTQLIWPGLLVALLSGAAGGLFARLMIRSLANDGRDRFSRLRRRRPVVFAAACGLAIALIGWVSSGATYGSGYSSTRAMLEGHESMPALYLLFKFVATWLTAWSGVPGGIFAPALAIGAALGNDIALLTGYPHAPTLIALGMTGFLAATTRAPLTSFIIVMEMVDGHAMVLSLMACALLASAVSKVLSPPLYPTLALMQLARLPRETEATPSQDQHKAHP
ncbi:chloride channel protein [Paucibacter sp. KBW04]|uniref:chloride channel protein n=1 Tax=Paucibacter sp. KBW04 TaxID=2153361 RepID=UPI000F570F51|nr:chloride channel protein [Paucibacter sp. KBW04]RQO57320.1 chloride channel protein [Paucibacter sp. KBW04]